MLKIAIVDDVEMTRIGLSFLLNKFKEFELVGEASNGRMFLNLLATVKPDIVLMDVNMPIMNGIDATRQIRKIEEAINKSKGIRIVAMTANVMKQDKEEYLASGMNDFVSKPFKIIELINILEKINKKNESE